MTPAAPADASSQIERLAGPLRDCRPAGGQHGVRHYRCQLADGRLAFAKLAGASEGGFEAEARGLRWLAEANPAIVPEVLGWNDSALVITWVPAGQPDRAAAGRFGQELARLHAAGADAFGAPWPGTIASLPLPNDQSGEWPDWYARQRLLPYLRLAAGRGLLGPADVTLVESVAAALPGLAGPAEPPARIHGDCWSGNVLWSAGRGVLIDPAAHGGHRETDLAMLALFGVPFLDQVIAAYQEAAPLAPGWRARVALHQLHPLLVHVCLFGTGYAGAAADAARRALRAG
ncbi:MAG TPA: fructosamine kinase family protein [Streptosporangiaceae bacterium]